MDVDAIVDPVCVDDGAATGLWTVTKEDKTWSGTVSLPGMIQSKISSPGYLIMKSPSLLSPPPSIGMANPEEPARQPDSEDEREESEHVVGPDFEEVPELELGSEHEESEYNDESELEYADEYHGNPVTEITTAPEPHGSEG